MSKPTSEERFNKLRDQYIKANEDLDRFRSELRLKYGTERWASAAERKRIDALSDRDTRAANKIFALIQALSPRDWSNGVPMHWVCRSLSFADVVRPKGEPLSVVPPLAYGSTEPMR